jgi:hypothetical protein
MIATADTVTPLDDVWVQGRRARKPAVRRHAGNKP